MRLRLIAHRHAQGATAGRTASSFFDTERWLVGTFNDATGRAQAGIVVLQLNAAS